jgi:hypothetical protein
LPGKPPLPLVRAPREQSTLVRLRQTLLALVTRPPRLLELQLRVLPGHAGGVSAQHDAGEVFEQPRADGFVALVAEEASPPPGGDDEGHYAFAAVAVADGLDVGDVTDDPATVIAYGVAE